MQPDLGGETLVRPAIRTYIEARLSELAAIPNARRGKLLELTDFIAEHSASNQPAALTFICTHNSRRSHMAQIWAQTAAAYFGVEGIRTFSGGTEATAFNPQAVRAIERAGFQVQKSGSGDNPIYRVQFRETGSAMECFSKRFGDPPNPSDDFYAVMVCSQADAACPFVPGAARRIAIPYDDPKSADGSEGERTAYDERCTQIAREMLYVFASLGRP
jgi:protein-tyrosine-phosphatase